MTRNELKNIREKTGLSQEALGEKIGRSRHQVMRYEDGTTPIPHWLDYIIKNKDLKKIINK